MGPRTKSYKRGRPLTLIRGCGVHADPRKLYQVILRPFSEPQNQQYFVFGVRADPATTKVVNFCKCV